MTTNRKLKPGTTIRFSNGKTARVLFNHADSMNGNAPMMRLTVLDEGADQPTTVYVLADRQADIV